MNGALDGRVGFITDVTRNIGLATAELFARNGASQVVTGRNAETVERTAESLRALGPAVVAVAADATSTDAMTKLGRLALSGSEPPQTDGRGSGDRLARCRP